MFPPQSITRLGQRLATLGRRARLSRRREAQGTELVSFVRRIEASRTALHGFGQTSDEEFSALARGLAQLNASLAALRTQAEAMDAILQGRDDDRAISSAYALYKDSVDLVHASAGIAVSAQEQLSQVESALGQCCGRRGVFERAHLFLRIVTLSIRIEASRLPVEEQTVFLNVASAIGEAGEKIRTCTARAFDRIDEVIAESCAARAELKATEEALHHRARRSIDTMQSELSALQAALAPCLAQSGDVGRLLAAAQPQTLAVIGALQHQDIVRQQLEHVCEGFQDLGEHFTGENGPEARLEWAYVQQAARVQAAQLTASQAEIQRAGTAVMAGLRALLDTSAAMVERFSAMESTAATALDRCRVVALFDQELRSLTGIIDQSQQANVRTDRLVDRIDEIVRLFSEDIGRCELDVKIVALNAQIAAARISSADALNRLAAETSAVSDANVQVSRALSGELLANLAKLDEVKRGTGEFLTIVTREKSGLEQGAKIVGEKLKRLVDRVRSGSVRLSRDFEPVHRAGETLLAQVGFPQLIASAFAPALQLCGELVVLGPVAGTSGECSEAARRKIEQHQSRYTMQKEEAVHTAALADATVAPVEPPRPIEAGLAVATTVTTAPDNLGDGIELF